MEKSRGVERHVELFTVWGASIAAEARHRLWGLAFRCQSSRLRLGPHWFNMAVLHCGRAG